MKHRSTDVATSPARRDEIDPVFKEVLSFRFRQLGIPLQTEVEVSRIPRTIDALIVLEREVDLQTVREQTPFAHFLHCDDDDVCAVDGLLIQLRRYFRRTTTDRKGQQCQR